MPELVDEPVIACTLTGADFSDRVASIADLNRRALTASGRDDLRLHLEYARDARSQVLAMVRGEEECCAFLKFAVTETANVVRVVIEAPEAAREFADAVFAPFVPSAAVSNACACTGAARA